MKVLLTPGAEMATADTILVLPHELETVMVTLTGRPEDRGFIAEANLATAHRAVRDARRATGPCPRSGPRVIEELYSLAVDLDQFELGSEVSSRVVGRGLELDTSAATPIFPFPGVGEGDAVVIGPCGPLTNARGRVSSTRQESVWVELDPADRERIERSQVKPVPAKVFIPRTRLERPLRHQARWTLRRGR